MVVMFRMEVLDAVVGSVAHQRMLVLDEKSRSKVVICVS